MVLKSQAIPMESERCPVNGLAAVEGLTPVKPAQAGVRTAGMVQNDS